MDITLTPEDFEKLEAIRDRILMFHASRSVSGLYELYQQTEMLLREIRERHAEKQELVDGKAS